eukprot:scaffold313668_cov23-Attheya_sp.AAC.1
MSNIPTSYPGIFQLWTHWTHRYRYTPSLQQFTWRQPPPPQPPCPLVFSRPRGARPDTVPRAGRPAKCLRLSVWPSPRHRHGSRGPVKPRNLQRSDFAIEYGMDCSVSEFEVPPLMQSLMNMV